MDIGSLTSYDYDNVDPGFTIHAVAYYSKESDPSHSQYLEVTYSIPEQPKPADLISTLMGYVGAGSDLPKQIKNSYDAQIKKLQQFYDNALWHPLQNQLSALVNKVTADIGHGKVSSSTGSSIIETANTLQKVLATSTATTTTAIRPVPLMTQIASPYPPESAHWENDIYGNGTHDWCGNTIGGCGCAITSMAMLGRSYGITTGVDGSNVDPGHMNAWLKTHNGYTGNNELRWYYGLQYLSTKPGYSSIQLDHVGEKNMSVIDRYVSQGKPAVAFKRSKGHYLVLSGVQPDGNYTVRDPFWYNTTTMNDTKDIANHVQNYGGTIDFANLFSHSSTAQPLPRWIEIHLGSPAELLLTDRQGRRTGYDPETGTIVDEIPGSAYVQAANVVTADTVDPQAPTGKLLTVTAPHDDLYTLSVIGTGSGPYHLSVDTGGGFTSSEISYTVATTTVGAVDDYVVDVPVRDSSTRAVSRLRELATQKELVQPAVADQLRGIAERLEQHNLARVGSTTAHVLSE